MGKLVNYSCRQLTEQKQMRYALKFSFWAFSIPRQVFCSHTRWICHILRIHQEKSSLVENIVHLCQSPLCISGWPNQGQVSRKGLVVGIWYFSKTCACMRLTKPKDPYRKSICGKTTLLFCIGICQHTQGSLQQYSIGKIRRLNYSKSEILENGDNYNLCWIVSWFQLFRQVKWIILGYQFQKLSKYKTIG